jgi:hypothetical protein
VYEYLLKWIMPERFITSQRQYLAQTTNRFVFQEGVLYNLDKITSLSNFATRIGVHNFARITWRSYKRVLFFWYHYTKDHGCWLLVTNDELKCSWILLNMWSLKEKLSFATNHLWL